MESIFDLSDVKVGDYLLERNVIDENHWHIFTVRRVGKRKIRFDVYCNITDDESTDYLSNYMDMNSMTLFKITKEEADRMKALNKLKGGNWNDE